MIKHTQAISRCYVVMLNGVMLNGDNFAPLRCNLNEITDIKRNIRKYEVKILSQ